MIKMLLNPFEKYTEVQLFIFGLIVTLVGAYAGFYFDGKFMGTMSINFSGSVGFTESLIDNGINIACFWLLLFILAKIINKRTRAIDILNTVLIARIPFYFLFLCNFTGFLTVLSSRTATSNPLTINFSNSEMAFLIITGIIAIAFLVWFIVLLYNGFRVASNAKAVKHKIFFAIVLIAADLLAKYLTITFN